MKEQLTVKDIVDVIEELVPAGLQEEWDNSGLLIGFEDRQVSRVLTCLEVNMQIVDEAIAEGAELIVCHHPLIFSPMKSFNISNPKDSVIIRLIRHGISVYACHTPFDKANGGNNDALAGILDLKKIKDLAGEDVPSNQEMLANPSMLHIGRIGSLKHALKFSQIVDLVCESLGLELSQVSAAGDMDTEISRVAVCSGAGSEFISQAKEMGCQVLVTGDVKYHAAQDACDMGMCVIDAGHYGTEKIFPTVMRIMLEKGLSEVEIIDSKVDLNPFVVL